MTTPVLQPSSSYIPLRRDRAALILIDLQVGHLGAIKTISPEQLTRNVAALTQIARLYALPVILTGSKQPPPEGLFLPEVTRHLPDPTVVERTTSNAWNAPEFVAAVEATGRRQLVLAGVALDIGVALPALSAGYEVAGYEVAVVVDATGATDARVETGTLMRLAARGIALVSWASVGMELQGDLALPQGRELMQIIGASFAQEHDPFRVEGDGR